MAHSFLTRVFYFPAAAVMLGAGLAGDWGVCAAECRRADRRYPRQHALREIKAC